MNIMNAIVHNKNSSYVIYYLHLRMYDVIVPVGILSRRHP